MTPSNKTLAAGYSVFCALEEALKTLLHFIEKPAGNFHNEELVYRPCREDSFY
jgi:hypothetical protein